MSKLKLIAIGHIGRDCTVKNLESGQSAINFSIACTETYVDRSGTKHERTTWVDCTLWRKSDKLKIADYLKKGTLVSVEGRPDTRAYESKNVAGKLIGALLLRVDELILLSKGNGSPVAQNTTSNSPENMVLENTEPVFSAASQEDDLPF